MLLRLLLLVGLLALLHYTTAVTSRTLSVTAVAVTTATITTAAAAAIAPARGSCACTATTYSRGDFWCEWLSLHLQEFFHKSQAMYLSGPGWDSLHRYPRPENAATQGSFTFTDEEARHLEWWGDKPTFEQQVHGGAPAISRATRVLRDCKRSSGAGISSGLWRELAFGKRSWAESHQSSWRQAL